MELTQQRKLVDGFMDWFEGSGTGAQTSLKDVIEDNRRRYRMQPSAEDNKRKTRNLSSLTSPKSRAIVDGIADAFLSEYHQEKDSISYTARRPGNIGSDLQARWLTEIFTYRCQNTFPFYEWHTQSITAGLVDGLEAAMVSWKHEFYTEEKEPTLLIPGPMGQPVPASPEQAAIAEMQGVPVQVVPNVEKCVVADTFWIDGLVPGETVFWDPKVPYLDVNLGGFCCAVVYKSLTECVWYAQNGLFDKARPEDMEQYRKPSFERTFSDDYKTFGDPQTIDIKDINRIPVWAFFRKNGFKWEVQFSMDGKQLLSDWKCVNKTFFNGRKVNRLPVVVGKSKTALYESTGIGTPYLIASHEDEWSRNRNDIQDAARLALMQKWRITRGADVNIDDVLNRPAFYADPGDIERVDTRVDLISAQRGNDQIDSEIIQLAPTTISQRGRSVAPKGTNQTLGAVQLMDMDSNSKKNNQMRMRNETFLKPVLSLIAELIFAYESDEMIVRIAGQKAGMQVPMSPQPQGPPMVDFSALDFPVNVQINAGMGHVAPYQKGNMLMQIADWRKSHNVPTNMGEIAAELNALAGFDPEAFTAPPPQPPPAQVDYKLNIDIPAMMLPPEAQQFLMMKFMTGQMDVNAKIPDPMKEVQKQSNQRQQNGGAGQPPTRTNQPIVNATGDAALGMSRGGMGGMQ